MGPSGSSRSLAPAIDVFERKIQLLERGGWFARPATQAEARSTSCCPPSARPRDPLTRDLYLGRASEAAGVDRELLVREVAAEPGASTRRARRPAAERTHAGPPEAPPRDAPVARPGSDPYAGVVFDEMPPKRNDWKDRAGQGRDWKPRKGAGRRAEEWISSDARPRVQHGRDALGAERDLTRAMLHERGHVETVAERYGPEASDTRCTARSSARCSSTRTRRWRSSRQRSPTTRRLRSTSSWASRLENEHSVVDASLVRLAGAHARRRLNEIDRRLIDTASPPSDGETDALVREKMRLMAERKVLVPIGRKFGKAGSRGRLRSRR